MGKVSPSRSPPSSRPRAEEWDSRMMGAGEGRQDSLRTVVVLVGVAMAMVVAVVVDSGGIRIR